MTSDILRGYTDTMILSRLKEHDSYGYEINKELQKLSQGRFEMKEATLYTAFRRLESAGISENMKDALLREEYHQTAWQLTWADAPEWDSHEYSLLYDLLAVKDAWMQPEEMDSPCFAVMFYGGLYALLITFVPNANRVVEARAQLIPSRAADELNIPIE